MNNSDGSVRRFLRGVVLFSAILGISIGCSKPMDDKPGPGNGTGGNGGSGGPGTNEVWIQNLAFNPSSITVTAGTTIKWTNKDGVSHTVTSDGGIFDSGSIASGGTFTFTFAAAGTFQYHCSTHPAMTAKVTVN